MPETQPTVFDCVVCGSAVVDILVRPFPLDRPVGEGTLRIVDPIRVATGGIVSNAGIAMARLGLKVAALGQVGSDHWGDWFRSSLQYEGVDTSHLATHPSLPTTSVVVMIDSCGQRSFVYSPGATAALDGRLLLDNLELFSRSHMALIGYYSALPALEPQLADVLQAIRGTGCRTALDSAGDGGPFQPLGRALEHLDVYVPSLTEATNQTGSSDPRQIVEVYRRAGAKGLVGVKLGPQGALLNPTPGEYIKVDAIQPPASVVDTTGAGDAFYAGLLTGLLRGMPPAQAGRLGAAAASLSITAVGATTALGSLDETLRLAGLR
ncbi:MAG TPA: carbohydrate kinase family protein [Planctomycetaceae bacterium]|nr:carbohydrate kinase family protein [Planctomycetaceae bacterium]HIQ21515.1 carbohydrate kinase family protein [Planctomycetota bacterium]